MQAFVQNNRRIMHLSRLVVFDMTGLEPLYATVSSCLELLLRVQARASYTHKYTSPA